ncbi:MULTISPECIES: hypothetical protein [Pseudomonas]|jgi:hypothetical protein|uniref:hypothetical protein n=1 Tax=Pseudomonas TaxID=286 RepID=UPI001C7E2E68|nr:MULTISPECIES: hypothetical protein [Pseudomonas]MDG9928670.1 hypothetical protein [Pseudomonas sp. GD04042]MDH0481739.1 hypothetical protein [Pseudomonas sp. GD04015]MDH0603111.1 hypothetical protein [Pseudomonas sp. GD03869]MDH0895796.1 hypothetical protein [Pseudomonas sp. GD03875]MDH1064908.1 hypothetical protein [Pseudomonas sp. GD03985]
MKRLVLLVVTLALVAGCSATAKTYEKKGRKGLNINCSGLTSSWKQCEDKATHACGPKGYRVVAKAGADQGDDSADFVFGLNPAGFSSRSMVVICK